MNQKKIPELCFTMIFEDRKDKIAALKKSIREGTYPVKAEAIAARILKECLWDIVSTLPHHKFQKCRTNWSISQPENTPINPFLKSRKREEQ
jgi:hypothetical protein